MPLAGVKDKAFFPAGDRSRKVMLRSHKGLGGLVKIAVLDVRTQDEGHRSIVGQAILAAVGRMPVKDHVDGVFSGYHPDADAQNHMLPLSRWDVVLPGAPAIVIEPEGIQAVRSEFL
jgi:hypothetical protein